MATIICFGLSHPSSVELRMPLSWSLIWSLIRHTRCRTSAISLWVVPSEHARRGGSPVYGPSDVMAHFFMTRFSYSLNTTLLLAVTKTFDIIHPMAAATLVDWQAVLQAIIETNNQFYEPFGTDSILL